MRNRSGVAVVTAMVVVAIVTTVVGELLFREGLRIKRVGVSQSKAQADALADTALSWAGVMIADQAKAKRIDPTAIEAALITSLSLGKGTITARIVDEQRYFNLNNMVRGGVASAPDLKYFERLLHLLDLDHKIAASVTDYLDPDDNSRLLGGAESGHYLRLDPPRRAANRPLFMKGELNSVAHISHESYAILASMVSSLPQPTTLNINSAEAETIAALFDNLSIEKAQKIVRLRNGKPFTSVDDFEERTKLTAPARSRQSIGFHSRFYKISIRIAVDKVVATVSALVHILPGGQAKNVWIRRG